MRKCECCGRERELRFGHCWECATAESIIHDGTDMYGKGLDGGDTPAVTPMEKVKLLIQKRILNP